MKKYLQLYLEIIGFDNLQDILTASPATDGGDNLISWSDLSDKPIDIGDF